MSPNNNRRQHWINENTKFGAHGHGIEGVPIFRVAVSKRRGDFTMNVAIVLAAGQGQRMRSKTPKVLHKITGLSMVGHVIRNVRAAGIDQTYLVIGHQGELVKQEVPDVIHVEQAEQLGTGHAVNQCRVALAEFEGIILVTYGDTPLFTADTFQQVLEYQREQMVAATVITAIMADPTGYGRIIRSESGRVTRIVEQKDANPSQLEIQEINTGTYCFDSQLLFTYLDKITPDNAQAEYYLPDVLPLLLGDGHEIAGYCISEAQESIGVNDRVQLAEAEQIMRKRICRNHMLAGVTIIDPQSTYIELDCQIGQDTVIHPNTHIQQGSVIGADCTVGPNARLTHTQLGNGVNIEQSVVLDSTVGDNCQIGPFAYLRPGSKVGADCKIGDFVELKNTTVDTCSKIPHHCYIGDAQVGSGVNIGCGTITCNYDGEQKHKTVIGNNSFIGSNSSLVAPLRIEDGAYIAAGSTITKDVPKENLAFGRARQVNKEGWQKRRANSDS